MRGIVFSLAVLLASFWLTAPAFGQCENGVCRRPVAKALAAPVSVGAASVKALGKVAKPVVVGVAKVGLGTAKVAALPAKAMKQVACNCQERRCERRVQRGPIFPRLHARRCCR